MKLHLSEMNMSVAFPTSKVEFLKNGGHSYLVWCHSGRKVPWTLTVQFVSTWNIFAPIQTLCILQALLQTCPCLFYQWLKSWNLPKAIKHINDKPRTGLWLPLLNAFLHTRAVQRAWGPACLRKVICLPFLLCREVLILIKPKGYRKICDSAAM